MSRINLAMDIISAIQKMCDGNPGAMTALLEIMKCAEKIDPNDFMGGFGKILALDTLEIYGTDIYFLWNYICDRNTSRMITVLRANQLGFISDQLLRDVCHRQDRSKSDIIPVEELYSKVVERLPEFDLANR